MKATLGALETMRMDEAETFQPEVALLPLGSTEPHGPHLPYGTDSIIGGGVTAEAVRLANQAGARVLLLPLLPYGNNVNFKAFPLACRIGVETLSALLRDLARFTVEEGLSKLVIVNAHGGNADTIKAALRQIYDQWGDRLFACTCGPSSFAGAETKELFSDRSPHAGEYETSMVEHLAPALVKKGNAIPRPMRQPLPELFAYGQVDYVTPWHRLMPEACGGRPDQASTLKGAQFFEAATKGMAHFLIELSRAAWHPGFPFPGEPPP